MALRLRILAALVAAAGLLLTAAPPAESATGPVYAGRGWKVWTDNGIYSLNPDPYTIVFADTAARTKLKPYLLKPAAQASTVTGVQITVTDLIDTTPALHLPSTAPDHRLLQLPAHRRSRHVAGPRLPPDRRRLRVGRPHAHRLRVLDVPELVLHGRGQERRLPVERHHPRTRPQPRPRPRHRRLERRRHREARRMRRDRHRHQAHHVRSARRLPQPHRRRPLHTPFDEPGLRQLAANWYLR